MLKMNGLDSMIGYRLKIAQMAVFEDFMESVAEAGLRPAQFSTLLLIEANEGSKQTEIAMALGIQRPNFVKLLDELEARGLAKRKIAEDDKRSHGLYLTKMGKTRLLEAKTALIAHENAITEKIGVKGREKLLELLSLVHDYKRAV